MKVNFCKRCNLPIIFVEHNHKWLPKNPDGSEHWDSCKTEVNKGKVFQPISSGVITGENYIETHCDCLPWVGCNKCTMPR